MEEVGTLLYYGKVHVAVATACFFFVTLSRSGEMEEVGTLLYCGKVHVAVATAFFFFPPKFVVSLSRKAFTYFTLWCLLLLVSNPQVHETVLPV